jgi:hypothetical protein
MMESQLRQELVRVSLKSAPDFDNDQIEIAASQVVANQKLKEAATAAQDAAKIETETKRIQAQTFENPKMYALELQRLKVQEAEMWAKHQGTLIIGQPTGQNLQLQIPNK